MDWRRGGPQGRRFKILLLRLVGAVMIFAGITLLWVLKAGDLAGTTYYVSPQGNDTRIGLSQDTSLATIQKALQLAQPGDTVQLADGRYQQTIRSVRSGTKHAPITIHGSRQVVVTGKDPETHIVDITHSYVHLEGFTINGQVGNGGTKADYRDKLIYVQGTTPKKGVKGLKIENMLIENAGGECLRLRYFATNNEVSHSTIRNCGIFDFSLADGGKNGEGIYIGTAPEQRKDGKNPTADPDHSTKNWIHHNIIETNGNECVDIKEGATDNLVEHNTCSHQLDPESAGLDARGEHNIFRYNTVRDTVGAAVRLGGDAEDNGINNDVYGNTFDNNARGAVKVMRLPQGKVCGNTLTNQPPDNQDENTTRLDPTERC